MISILLETEGVPMTVYITILS